MTNCREAAINGFNCFLKDQQSIEGLAKLTLVLFNETCQVPIRSLPVREITELDERAYVPDAIEPASSAM